MHPRRRHAENSDYISKPVQRPLSSSGIRSHPNAVVTSDYGVAVAICPARRGNRKGVVEKVNHTAAQRWWRTLADDLTVEAAQASVDRFARVRGDTRIPATADGRSSVATVATA